MDIGFRHALGLWCAEATGGCGLSLPAQREQQWKQKAVAGGRGDREAARFYRAMHAAEVTGALLKAGYVKMLPNRRTGWIEI